jgi:hypothetical protein
MSAANKQRLTRLSKAIRRLPARERPLWVARVAKKLREAPNASVSGDGGLLDGVKVIRPGDPGYEQARANDANKSTAEWDLELANWLDRVYGVVSDRTKELAQAVPDAIPAQIWWLAIAGVGLYVYLASRKQGGAAYG